MRNEIIIHNLAELEKHVEKIKVNLYARLGLVDNFQPTNKEIYEICKIEFELFKQRIQDLQLELKIDQKKTDNKKEMMSS
ncbi:hypothetical protein [Niallia circulans]|uniref:hypothetical protein n=1 Tax=Niallia circulans TaxID=1397 RepID=UPI0026F071C1|nr:hypothetical protein [Niallia circulans]